MEKHELELIKYVFDTEEEINRAIKEYESGKPLAYVLGEWYFYGLTFKLNEHCLIPRADTEHVVDKALQLLPRGGKFADLCTGSGCIAISALKTRSDLWCYAMDISPKAVAMAAKNAELNGVDSRIDLNCGDVFEEILPENEYDAVISNPPYIPTENIGGLDERVKKEPRSALNGGKDGLKFYKHILSNMGVALKDGGKFIFEIGYDQKQAICELAKTYGYENCEVMKDYGGNDRVAVIY